MKTQVIVIDDKKKMFEIPTSWHEVTVNKYRRLYTMDPQGDELMQRVQLISIMLDIDIDLVLHFTTEDLHAIESEIAWFGEPIDQVEVEVVDYIEVKGEKFYLNTNFEKLSVGEQISINVLMDKSQGNIMTVYNELLCIFLRKKREDGKLELFKADFIEERAAMFDDVPILIVNKLLVFFSNGGSI